jgi:hypothetical protein
MMGEDFSGCTISIVNGRFWRDLGWPETVLEAAQHLDSGKDSVTRRGGDSILRSQVQEPESAPSGSTVSQSHGK